MRSSTFDRPRAGELADALARAVELGRNMVRVLPATLGSPRRGAGAADGELFSTARACPSCSRSFEPLDPRLFSYNSRYGWCPACYGTGVELADFDDEQSGEEAAWTDAAADAGTCEACAGRRLKPEALAVRLHGESIAEVTARSVADAHASFKKLKLEAREREIARDVVPELVSRLGFLDLVGLGYLTLDRAAPTLSGGEAQRIRLAAQLGSNLRGVCYILDEPTIGLHPRDNALLLDTIEKLVRKGNTVVVVEHDEETIRRAEHVVDLGPGAGRDGGEVIVNGSLRDLLASERSITGRMLAAPPRHPLRARRTDSQGLCRHGLARARGRHAPQPAQARCRVAAGAARLRDGRERQRQEHADPRSARGQSRKAGHGAPRSTRRSSRI